MAILPSSTQPKPFVVREPHSVQYSAELSASDFALTQSNAKGMYRCGRPGRNNRGHAQSGATPLSILTIDFEASCLPRHGRSFPIEVGVAVEGWSCSWLIRPHNDWADWTWTQEAQALHGLDRTAIAQKGLDADIVLALLSDAAVGRRVVADSRIDQQWLDTLAAAAGRPTPFVIEHVSTIVTERGTTDMQIRQAMAVADRRCPTRHRAGTDALWLATMLAHLPLDASGRLEPVLSELLSV